MDILFMNINLLIKSKKIKYIQCPSYHSIPKFKYSKLLSQYIYFFSCPIKFNLPSPTIKIVIIMALLAKFANKINTISMYVKYVWSLPVIHVLSIEYVLYKLGCSIRIACFKEFIIRMGCIWIWLRKIWRPVKNVFMNFQKNIFNKTVIVKDA